MCTIHANGPRQALSKLRTYAMMAEESLPARSVTEMIAEAIDLVVHLRLDASSGRRLISSIYEVTGLEEDAVAGSEIFALTDGTLRWTGIRPRSAARLQGVGLPWTRPDSTQEGLA
jgi:pilus assembly protein CpaF